MLGRELLSFLSIDATAIPPRQRPGYAAVAISRWVPFEDSAHHIEWMDGRAMVWAWSESAALTDSAGVIEPVRPRRIWPEPVFRGSPAVDGEELVRMHSGVEGRIWKQFALVGTEWWPETPGLDEWNRFRRGAGMPPAAQLPLVLESPLSRVPWSKRRAALSVGDLAAQHRQMLAGIVLALAVLCLMVPLAASFKFWLARQGVERDIAALDTSLSRILTARDATVRDVDEVGNLLALRPPASQIELMAAALALVPGGDWEVLEWRMPDKQTLEVEARMSRPDPAALARAWEAAELFDEVTVELGQSPDTVRIKANIVRMQAGGAR